MAQSINGRHHQRVIIATIRGSAAILSALALVLSVWEGASADRIVLKDGSVEVSERVWESADHIHFILNGTRDVEIRYAKHIVERIERDANRESAIQAGEVDQAPLALSPSDKREDNPMAETIVSPGVLTPQPPHTLAKASKGISFYDPRRPMRYWAHATSKHDRLEEALIAMAALYSRSAKWVTRHMGDENDLGTIHANLFRQVQAESGASADEASKAVGPSTAKRDTHAIEHTTREQADDQNANGEKPMTRPIAIKRAQHAVNIAPGVQFYDPRRPQKYWSGRMVRHNTLQEAIAALAAQYGTTPGWIERHMGDTNDLAKIHQSIQQNLPTP